MENGQKIYLVINVGKIGDVLATTPLCKEIKMYHPDSKLIFICASATKTLVENIPEVDESYVYDKDTIHKGFFGVFKFLKEFKYREPDYCFVVHRYLRGNFLAFFLRPKAWISDYHESRNWRFLLTHPMYKDKTAKPKNIIKRYSNYINFKPSENYDITSDLSYTVDKKSAQEILAIVGEENINSKKLVAMVFNDCWKAPKLAELIKEVCSLGYTPVLIGTKDILPITNEVKELVQEDYIDLVGKTNLLQSFAAVDLCEFSICVDTGLMHMSVALNKPTIALMMNSYVELWGHKEKSFILASKYDEKVYDDISVEDVVEKVKENILQKC